MYWRIITEAMKSSANICIIPAQDYLGLDNSARMNQPSTLSSNWSWRMKADALTESLQKDVLALTKRYGRFNWACVEEE
jgi:4-alpha-glucanotransferase